MDGDPVNVTDPTGLCGGWLTPICATTNQWFDHIRGADSAVRSGGSDASGFLSSVIANIGRSINAMAERQGANSMAEYERWQEVNAGLRACYQGALCHFLVQNGVYIGGTILLIWAGPGGWLLILEIVIEGLAYLHTTLISYVEPGDEGSP